MNRRCGKSLAVNAVILFSSVAPAVYIVVAHDIEKSEKLRTCCLGGGLGVNVIAAGGHQAGGVLSVKDREQLPQRLRTLRAALVSDFVTGAPEYYGGMITIAPRKVLNVALIPFVEVLGVAVGTDLALRHFPLVESLIHYEESHPVA